MITAITSAPWKAATIGTAALTLIASGLLVAEKIETRSLNKQLGNRNERIEVLSRDLGTAQRNNGELEKAIASSNASLVALQKEGEARIAAAAAKVATAQAETRRAEAKVAALLNEKPKGDTLDERVRDIDARILESLK